eukprot:12026273-Alexandrium_andersonii.AAC.1
MSYKSFGQLDIEYPRDEQCAQMLRERGILDGDGWEEAEVLEAPAISPTVPMSPNAETEQDSGT